MTPQPDNVVPSHWSGRATDRDLENAQPLGDCAFVVFARAVAEMNLTFGLTATRSGKSELTLVGVGTSWWPAVMDTGSKSELPEDPNGVIVDVDFVPLQPVPGGNRVGMMKVVMPPVSETYQCDPPIVR